MVHDPAQAKRLLRQRLRQQRRLLNLTQQAAAAQALAAYAPLLRRYRRIAAYLPSDGEIDPQRLLQRLQRRAYLPCLQGQSLCFRISGSALKEHRLGVQQPARGRPYALWQLDAVLLPLVAFDRQGHRLGRGGGYYDRAIAELDRRPRRPRLIGLAHHFQGLQQLPTEAWDQALNALICDRYARFFTKKS